MSGAVAPTATWTQAVSSGSTVWASYSPFSGATTAARYQVFDGSASTGSLIRTVTINQQSGSGQDTVSTKGLTWKSLGIVRPQTRNITVVVSAPDISSNYLQDGYVVEADAIRLDPCTFDVSAHHCQSCGGG
jgi:hypothetical protein